jgi:hypothetical protein
MVWEALLEQQDRLALFNTELISWFINNLAFSKGTQEGKHWSITFGVAIWYIFGNGEMLEFLGMVALWAISLLVISTVRLGIFNTRWIIEPGQLIGRNK